MSKASESVYQRVCPDASDALTGKCPKWPAFMQVDAYGRFRTHVGPDRDTAGPTVTHSHLLILLGSLPMILIWRPSAVAYTFPWRLAGTVRSPSYGELAIFH